MSDVIDPFLRGFGYSPVDLPLSQVEWMTNNRVEAKNHYERLGFPTVRKEEWKYTNLKSVRNVDYRIASPIDAAADIQVPVLTEGFECYRMVLVNGVFQAELSDLDGLPEGVTLNSLAREIEANPASFETKFNQNLDQENDVMIALNSAYLADGYYLNVARGVHVDKPIHIVSLTDTRAENIAFYPRHCVHIADGARATIVESHMSVDQDVLKPSFSNAVTEIEIGRDGFLGHYKLQQESDQAVALSVSDVSADTNAVYDNFALQLGGAIIRNDIRARINGEHAEIRLNGAYHTDGERHHDTTTFVDHKAGNAATREIYKGVLDDMGRGVFQGKIRVQKGADGTDGQQLHKALLLSNKAEVDAKPELEIYADDVKCAHGSTSGALDDQQLFYLKSRGIDEERARAMLVQAFLHEVIDEIQHAEIAAIFHSKLADKLGDLG